VTLDPLLEALVSRILEIRSGFVNHVTTGSVPSQDSYREMRGMIQGIDLVISEIKQLSNEVYEDD